MTIVGKTVTLFLIFVLIFWLLTQPKNLANTVDSVIDLLEQMALALIRFFQALGDRG